MDIKEIQRLHDMCDHYLHPEKLANESIAKAIFACISFIFVLPPAAAYLTRLWCAKHIEAEKSSTTAKTNAIGTTLSPSEKADTSAPPKSAPPKEGPSTPVIPPTPSSVILGAPSDSPDKSFVAPTNEPSPTQPLQAPQESQAEIPPANSDQSQEILQPKNKEEILPQTARLQEEPPSLSLDSQSRPSPESVDSQNKGSLLKSEPSFEPNNPISEKPPITTPNPPPPKAVQEPDLKNPDIEGDELAADLSKTANVPKTDDHLLGELSTLTPPPLPTIPPKPSKLSASLSSPSPSPPVTTTPLVVTYNKKLTPSNNEYIVINNLIGAFFSEMEKKSSDPFTITAAYENDSVYVEYSLGTSSDNKKWLNRNKKKDKNVDVSELLLKDNQGKIWAGKARRGEDVILSEEKTQLEGHIKHFIDAINTLRGEFKQEPRNLEKHISKDYQNQRLQFSLKYTKKDTFVYKTKNFFKKA